MTSIEHLFLIVSVLLLAAVVVGRLSAHVSVPPLLLFLVVGMLAGSDGPGGIYFDDPWLAQLVGTAALALILFAGGLDTEWQHIRPVLWPGLTLSTLGVLATTLVVGWAATLILGFTWVEGLLLGAIVSATDAAAVFSIKHVDSGAANGRLLPLLELESGTNDPMAILLTVGLTQLLTDPHASASGFALLFLAQMGIGAVAGVVAGFGMVRLVNWLNLQVTGLYPVLTIALVLLIYGGTASLGGSGFLAVYLCGLVVGNGKVTERGSLTLFHGGLASLMEIAMFLTLGLLVFPSRLPAVAGISLLMTLVLIFVARPVSVLLCLIPFRWSVREMAFISWAGLRGAVPIVLATFPLLAGLPKSELIFDTVFFIVLVSLLVQGTTIPYAGRWLRVRDPANTAEPAR